MNKNEDERVNPSEGKKLLFLAKIPKDASPAEIRKIAEEMAIKMIESRNPKNKQQRSELCIIAAVLFSAVTFFNVKIFWYCIVSVCSVKIVGILYPNPPPKRTENSLLILYKPEIRGKTKV